MSFQDMLNIQSINEGRSQEYRDYFRAKRTVRNTSIMAPPELRDAYWTKVSYCRLACQVINERIDLDSVTASSADATVFINSVLEVNGGADLVARADIAAMEYGRSYLVPTGSDRDDGLPMVQVVTGRDMVHRINAYTGELTEALQTFGWSRDRYVYWNRESQIRLTLIQHKGERFPDATVVFPPTDDFKTNDQYPGFFVKIEALDGEIPVFPIMCRGEDDNTFGRPEAKDIFGLQDAGIRVTTDLVITSASMGSPKHVLLGAEFSDFAEHDADGEPIPGTEPSAEELYTSRVLTISDSAARIAEFSAAQLQNFTTALNSITRNVASTMGIPLSVFGVASDANPSSGDAMTQDDKRLIRRAETLTRGFEPGYRDLFRYLLEAEGFGTQTVVLRWTDPSLPNLAGRADAVLKLSTIKDANGNSVYTWQELRRMLGDPESEIRQAEDDRELTNIQTLLNEPPTPNGVPTNEQGTSPESGG